MCQYAMTFFETNHRLASEWARRAKRERRHVASRNPLKALAARTDLREEYVAPPSTLRDQLIKEKGKYYVGIFHKTVNETTFIEMITLNYFIGFKSIVSLRWCSIDTWCLTNDW